MKPKVSRRKNQDEHQSKKYKITTKINKLDKFLVRFIKREKMQITNIKDKKRASQEIL